MAVMRTMGGGDWVTVTIATVVKITDGAVAGGESTEEDIK